MRVAACSLHFDERDIFHSSFSCFCVSVWIIHSTILPFARQIKVPSQEQFRTLRHFGCFVTTSSCSCVSLSSAFALFALTKTHVKNRRTCVTSYFTMSPPHSVSLSVLCRYIGDGRLILFAHLFPAEIHKHRIRLGVLGALLRHFLIANGAQINNALFGGKLLAIPPSALR